MVSFAPGIVTLLFTLSSALAMQTFSRAKSDPSVEDRLDRLERQMADVVSQMSELTKTTSKITGLTRKVSAFTNQCFAQYVDGLLSLGRTEDYYRVEWSASESQRTSTFWKYNKGDAMFEFVDGSRREQVAGPYKELLPQFASVNAFAYVTSTIDKILKEHMTLESCSKLFDFIEQNPPPGHQPGGAWIGSFIAGQMNEAMDLARKYKQ